MAEQDRRPGVVDESVEDSGEPRRRQLLQGADLHGRRLPLPPTEADQVKRRLVLLLLRVLKKRSHYVNTFVHCVSVLARSVIALAHCISVQIHCVSAPVCMIMIRYYCSECIVLDGFRGHVTADIIFVHGLMGGPFKTWRQGKREKPKAELPQLLLPPQPPPPPPPPVQQEQQEDNTDSEQSHKSQDEGENIETNSRNTMKQLAVRAQYMIHQLSLKLTRSKWR